MKNPFENAPPALRRSAKAGALLAAAGLIAAMWNDIASEEIATPSYPPSRAAQPVNQGTPAGDSWLERALD